jgi:hypothetical protein
MQRRHVSDYLLAKYDVRPDYSQEWGDCTSGFALLVLEISHLGIRIHE